MLHDAATSCGGKAVFEKVGMLGAIAASIIVSIYVGVVVCVQPASAPPHSRGYLK